MTTINKYHFYKAHNMEALWELYTTLYIKKYNSIPKYSKTFPKQLLITRILKLQENLELGYDN